MKIIKKLNIKKIYKSLKSGVLSTNIFFFLFTAFFSTLALAAALTLTHKDNRIPNGTDTGECFSSKGSVDLHHDRTEDLRDVIWSNDGKMVFTINQGKFIAVFSIFISVALIYGISKLEVENRFMMEELNRAYLGRDYSIVHYDSPDSRGIDCALFYDSKVFKLYESKPIKNILPGNLPTRDIIHVKGTYEDQFLHIFVNHWPSNYGGREKAIPKRAATSNLSLIHI